MKYHLPARKQPRRGIWIKIGRNPNKKAGKKIKS